MSENVLYKLFGGQVYPQEEIFIDTPEYREAQKAYNVEKERFLSTLTEEQCANFDNMEALYETVADIYNCECFASGFRLAVKLILEGKTEKLQAE